jgi:hypothetical protein
MQIVSYSGSFDIATKQKPKDKISYDHFASHLNMAVTMAHISE